MKEPFEELSDVEQGNIITPPGTGVILEYDNILSYLEVAQDQLLAIDSFPDGTRFWNEVTRSNGIEANPVGLES